MSLVDQLLGKEESQNGKMELRVNGETFDGFERGSVTLSMETPYNSFDVEYVADSKEPDKRAIFAGDALQIALDGEVVIDGFVDSTEDDDDPDDGVKLRAIGYSRTIDLVKSSVVDAPFSWEKAKLDRIALDVCRPYGIDAIVLGSLGDPLDVFAVQRGEVAYDTLSRAALRRGKLIYCVGGDAVLASVGAYRTDTALIRGEEPLLRSSRSDSWESRHSHYVFSAQAPARDDRWGKSAAHINFTVTDENITRYLPLLVEAEAYNAYDLENRAKLERNQRAGRGERVSALVRGWATAEGTAWRPNTLVRMTNPVLSVFADLVVTTVRLNFAYNTDPVTELLMTRPEAFDVLDYPVSKRGKNTKAWE
jgi:prophage tail gpP-like protein